MATQLDLSSWVKAPRRKRVVMYRFLQDLPEVMATKNDTIGPFRKGDLVSAEDVPTRVWRVLMHHGVVEPVEVDFFSKPNVHIRTRKGYKG